MPTWPSSSGKNLCFQCLEKEKIAIENNASNLTPISISSSSPSSSSPSLLSSEKITPLLGDSINSSSNNNSSNNLSWADTPSKVDPKKMSYFGKGTDKFVFLFN